MEDERDGEDAIRALDMKEFGRKGRRLRVEWTKQDRGIRKPMGSKRSANTRPSKTLFVINFDPYNTRTRDLERHFDPYGKIENVRIRKNFAFIQFELQEDAARALEATNMSKLMDHVISVEYSVRDDDKKNGYSPRDGPYGGRDRGHSPSPYGRERPSPDYGRRDPSPCKRERPSPDYGRRRSPSPVRIDRANPDYGRDNVRNRSRSPYRRDKANPENVRIRSRSPYRRDKVSPDGGRVRSPSPYCIRSRSPYQKDRVRVGSDQGHAPSRSSYDRDIVSPDNQRERSVSLEEGERVNGRDPSTSPYGRKRSSPDYDDGRSSSLNQKEKDNTNNDRHDRSPNVRSAQGDSPISDGDNSPAHKGYRSRSPPLMRERSPSD